MIARPHDADTATLRGAAQFGLAQRPLVSSVIAPPRLYDESLYLASCGLLIDHADEAFKVKLPAEPEDMLKRPAYIIQNAAGIPTCENR